MAQRLRQQAGRSRQAARQTAPACSSRPFALVGTLTVRFPWADLSGWMPSEDVTMQKMQIFRWGKNVKAQQNAVGAPDMYYSVGRPTSRGRWCSPPVFGCSSRRATCTQTLSQDVKNQESLYLKAKTNSILFRQDRIRVITSTITFTLNGHRYVSSATART